MTADRPIPAAGNPTVMSFGTDADAEVYFTIPSAKGQGIDMLLPPN